MFKTGLVVGKFCPLHKGHEYLIEQAISVCESVIIISYAKPGYDGCESETRRAWLEALYPSVIRLVIDDDWLAAHPSTAWPEIPHDDAPDDIHRAFTAWACFKVLGLSVDAVFTSEDYGDGFAEFLSRYFSNHANIETNVQHVCVDKAREIVPISGTQIRQSPARYRQYLSDTVYASFVKRMVILGGESTGKTTLCAAIAKRINTIWAQEYGRELWDQKEGELVYEDLLHIGQTQVRREEDLLPQSRAWLVCDTSPLTTCFYSDFMFGKVDPELARLAERSYDAVFLCDADFDFVQDGTRQETEFRDRQQAWYKAELARREISYQLVSGDIDGRVDQVLAVIGRIMMIDMLSYTNGP